MLQVGTVGALPALCAVFGGWIGGYTSDALYRKGWSLTAARKTCLVRGLLLSSSVALAALVQSQNAAMALFCLSYASLAFTGANIWSLPADVAPTNAHVASIAGIQNFSSGLAGALTTTFTGYLVTISHGSFVTPLVVGGCVCVAGALAYLFIVGPIEKLPSSRLRDNVDWRCRQGARSFKGLVRFRRFFRVLVIVQVFRAVAVLSLTLSSNENPFAGQSGWSCRKYGSECLGVSFPDSATRFAWRRHPALVRLHIEDDVLSEEERTEPTAARIWRRRDHDPTTICVSVETPGN